MRYKSGARTRGLCAHRDRSRLILGLHAKPLYLKKPAASPSIHASPSYSRRGTRPQSQRAPGTVLEAGFSSDCSASAYFIQFPSLKCHICPSACHIMSATTLIKRICFSSPVLLALALSVSAATDHDTFPAVPEWSAFEGGTDVDFSPSDAWLSPLYKARSWQRATEPSKVILSLGVNLDNFRVVREYQASVCEAVRR